MTKGEAKNNFLKLNNGVNLTKLADDAKQYGLIKDITSDAAHQLVYSTSIFPKYDLNFHSKSFGHICIKKLLNKINPKQIQLFFEEFEQIKDVVMTVNDPDDPCFDTMKDSDFIIKTEDSDIDKQTFLILEFKNHKRMLPARFFWAILSKETKDFYIKKYHNQYQRLIQLLLDVDKEIILEEY
ncbi:MAG: hypothetical protein WC875_03855 [Candidatus Absconditabacterales bacterium]